MQSQQGGGGGEGNNDVNGSGDELVRKVNIMVMMIVMVMSWLERSI